MRVVRGDHQWMVWKSDVHTIEIHWVCHTLTNHLGIELIASVRSIKVIQSLPLNTSTLSEREGEIHTYMTTLDQIYNKHIPSLS